MAERPVTEPAARPSCRDGCQRMTAATTRVRPNTPTGGS